MNHETTDSTLADAIWWFHGFAAASPRTTGPFEEPCDVTHDLAAQLRNARDWIKNLAVGHRRSIGLDDANLACAVREGELEILRDGLRLGADEREREEAFELTTRIFDQFHDERKPEVPF